MLGNTNAKIVSGSPIPSQKEYFVKVIDYDGTVLDEQWLDNGEEYTLPSNPDRTNEGLVFQEWSCSQDIVNGKVTINKNNVMIGAVYTTTSGKNEFDIELNTVTGLSVTLNIDGTKDWGDGTTDSLTSHTYSQAGKYRIKCDGTTITSSNSSGFVGQNSSSVNYYLKSVRLVDGVNITNCAFQYCRNLETVTLSNNNHSTRNLSRDSFNNCYSLKAIVLPSLTTLASIGDGYNFSDCRFLEYIILPKDFTFGTGGQYTTYGRYFAQNCNLKNIVLPTNITFIPTNAFSNSLSNIEGNLIIPINVTSIASYAFSSVKSVKIITQNCSFGSNCFSSLKTKNFEIPTNITSLPSYFLFSSLLEEINIPNNITSIGNYCFNNCNSLKKVVMDNSVTSLGTYCFSSCYNLEDITLSDNITTLGSNCFQSCYNLFREKGFKAPSKLSSIGSNCFSGTLFVILEYDFSKCEQVPTLSNVNAFNLNGLTKIKVPTALYNSWITASNWVTLADYIVAV